MTGEPDPVDATPAEMATEAQQTLTVEQLAAVHSLIGAEQQVKIFDILVTTVMELLSKGPLVEAAAVTRAGNMWHGAGIDALRVAAALRTAERAGYVTKVSHVGETKWMLTPLGLEEQQTSREWATDYFNHTVEEVRVRLSAVGRNLGAQEAALWTSSLREVIAAGLADTFASYRSDVTANGRVLTARRVDEKAMRETASALLRGEDADLLFGLATDAFYRLDPFGNELVSAIIIGYLLHAVIGRRDHAAERRIVGSLRDVRVILDTPVLLRLLGPTDTAYPLEQAISAARAAGMEVVALYHYLEELSELVATVGRQQMPRIEERLTEGLNVDALIKLVDEEVVSLYLRAHVEERYADWPEFQAAADDLSKWLVQLDVMVRDHGNDAGDPVGDYERALNAEIARAQANAIAAAKGTTAPADGTKPAAVAPVDAGRRWVRRPAALARDAETMVMVHRRRETRERTFWPAAWIVTTDARMSPAYASLHPRDPFAITITPGAWVAIISNCSDPAHIPNLVEVASRLVSDDGCMAIAARFPVDAAIELAQTLGPDNGGSALDLSLAQGLGKVLREQPDYSDDDDKFGQRLAAQIVGRRGKRLYRVSKETAARASERSEALAEALVEVQRRNVEKDHEIAALRERDEERTRAEATPAVPIPAPNAWKSDEVVLAERRTASIFFTLGMLGIVLVLFVYAGWVPALIALFGLFVFVKQSMDWSADRNSSWKRLVVGFVVDIGAALIAVLIH
jgi:hypothetical protein